MIIRRTYHQSFCAVGIWCALCMITMLSGCANRGQGPQGGPRDSIPPTLLKETPVNGTCNFTGKTIVMQFDEYVQLDNVADNVLMSPPQKTPPTVKAVGKKVTVTFEEPLRDSTTYTIDFGLAICDNNEKTPLGDYSFSFSTGEHIDTLAMFGKVINAMDLNPVQGVVVGVHEHLHDSAFSALQFTRIAKTDSTGQFGILNMRGGNYRIYALRDVSRDYIYQPSEALAYTDEIFSPALATDSAGELYHVPDTIVLKLFSENKQRHYFIRALRDKEQHYFTLIFSAPQPSLPIIVALPPSNSDSLSVATADSTAQQWVDFTQHMLCQANPTKDTLIYWLTDSSVIRMDTLQFLMTYKMSDSLYQLVDTTDTVQAVYRHPRMSQKALEAKLRRDANRKVEIKTNASRKFDIYKSIEWYAQTPLSDYAVDSIHLVHKVDTVLTPVPFSMEPLDSVGLQFAIRAKLQPEQDYVLTIDSGAMHDVYGAPNKAFKATCHLRSLDEYSTLTIRLAQFDPKARIQILDEKDKVVREQPAEPDGAVFKYLEAKSYYVRLYIDQDGNGEWTTGDFALKRQPEQVYYYPKKLTLRANWEFEEVFDHLDPALRNTKPQALVQIDTGKKKK